MTDVTIDEFLGKTFSEIERVGNKKILFISGMDKYSMYHYQDCCEIVEIKDIVGDLQDLVGNPILRAEKRTKEGKPDYGTETWTFYELATIKGSVTISWHGESNGYYSEDVDIERVE